MYAFDFERPATLADAVKAMADEDALALSGGQTLIPSLKQRLAMPSKLVSLTGIDEIKGICVDDDGRVCIGAATIHADVAAQEHYPALAALASNVGDPAVRNRGTIGGSLANNDPSADYPAGLLALDGVIVTDKREIPAEDFFLGLFTTDLEETEIITHIRLPVAVPLCYEKFRNPASRYAIAGVAVARGDEVRIGVTGAGADGAYRWREAEEALTKWFETDALDAIEVDPAGLNADLHATAVYRAALVKELTRRAVQNLR